jgi:glucokinase
MASADPLVPPDPSIRPASGLLEPRATASVGATASPALPGAADAGFPRLVADVGGTHARFAWLDNRGAALSHVVQWPVAGHAGLAEALAAYVQQLPRPLGVPARPPRRAAVAVATAVHGDQVRLTNSAWHFSRREVQAALGLEGLVVLNDFEALALSLPYLGPGQRRCHGTQAPQASGTLAVVGPGTGLGVGAVVRTPSGWVALPGEGGHATLAPADALESALLDVVRRRHAHVSAERLLSGIGLPLLHQALGQVQGRASAEPWTTEAIVAEGVARRDLLASDTIDLFCALLGGFAGNVALTLGARSGLYVGGGIVPRLGERFFESSFRQRFEAKGRFQAYLQAIPTALITDTLAALAGAALAIDQDMGLAGV